MRAVLPLVALVLVTLPWHPCQQAQAAPPAASHAAMPDCGHCPDADPIPPPHCLDIDKKSGESTQPSSAWAPGAFVWLPLISEPRRQDHAAPVIAPAVRAPTQRLHLVKAVLLI
jgi:hypothetical protein